MKAAVLYEINTPLKIEEFDLPDTGPNQVRVRIVASGVCHSYTNHSMSRRSGYCRGGGKSSHWGS